LKPANSFKNIFGAIEGFNGEVRARAANRRGATEDYGTTGIAVTLSQPLNPNRWSPQPTPPARRAGPRGITGITGITVTVYLIPNWGCSLTKIDNFLPNRPGLDIVFQKDR
jgi:hypothetical protein